MAAARISGIISPKIVWFWPKSDKTGRFLWILTKNSVLVVNFVNVYEHLHNILFVHKNMLKNKNNFRTKKALIFAFCS